MLYEFRLLCALRTASRTIKSWRVQMRGTSGTPRHTKRSRYRCSLPGLAGFAGLRRTEPEVPRIGSRSTRKRLQAKSSTATRAKKENDESSEKVWLEKKQPRLRLRAFASERRVGDLDECVAV